MFFIDTSSTIKWNSVEVSPPAVFVFMLWLNWETALQTVSLVQFEYKILFSNFEFSLNLIWLNITTIQVECSHVPTHRTIHNLTTQYCCKCWRHNGQHQQPDKVISTAFGIIAFKEIKQKNYSSAPLLCCMSWRILSCMVFSFIISKTNRKNKTYPLTKE